MKNKRIDAHVYTNSNCNLKCKHCYNDSNDIVNIEQMTTNEIIEIIKILSVNYDADIHLEGGEIFLRSEIFNGLYDLPSEILENITITTNGTIFIDENKITSVLRSVEQLRISFEGHTDELNRLLRNVDIEEVLNTAIKYREKEINVVIRITLHQLNKNLIFKEIIPFFELKGFSSFQIYEYQSAGRGIKNKDEFVISDCLVAFLDEFDAYNGKSKISVMLNQSRRNEVENFLESKITKITFKEFEQSDSISIACNGDVRVCPWDFDETPIDNLKGKNIIDTLNRLNLIHDCEHCSKFKLEVN